MNLISAVYQKQFYSAHSGAWLDELAIQIAAEVEQFGDSLLVIWTDECSATLEAAGLDCDELIGAQEEIESAFWAAEREECRLSKVRQQNGVVAA